MSAVPVEEIAEPLRGVKLAVVRGAREPRFHPVGRYGPRAYERLGWAPAVCHRSRHAAPALDCTCGFHACATPAELERAVEPVADAVLLDVELAGTVIEHERGLRAEQQTVLGVGFSDRCRCGALAEWVVVGRYWRSACARCARHRRGRALARADATALLGIDVTFVEVPREPRSVRIVGVARSIAAGAIAIAQLVIGGGVHPSMSARAALVAIVSLSLACLVATLRVRSSRAMMSLFALQGLCMSAGTVLILAAAS